MPLEPGSNRAVVSRNIAEMVRAGHPQNQAVAAALANARRFASGGAPQVPAYASGSAPALTGAGLMAGVGGGDYRLDPNTGSFTPDTLAHLQMLAQRGLPIQGTPSATPPPPPPASPTPDFNPNAPGFDPTMSAFFQSLDAGGAHRGGRFAAGGMPTTPWFVRRESTEAMHPSGLVASATPGRRDVIPLSVASGSYVVPADVVSGISEGNTLAGARHLEAAMHTGPGGIPLAPLHTRSMMPHPPPMSHLARGGMADGQMPRLIHPHEWAHRDVRDGIPIIVAGGEYIYGPDDVRHIGDGDLKRGHDRLDDLVLRVRHKNVRTTAALPGPKKGNEK